MSSPVLPPRRSPLLESLGWIDHAFQAAGESPPADAAYGHQRHSSTVVLESENVPPKSCVSDGIIGVTTRPVAVYTADCLPVLIADARQRHVAAVHAGLQGALAGVLFSAVERLKALGARNDTLFVAIGPAILPCCYELGEEVLADIQQNRLLQQPVSWSAEQPQNVRAVRPQAQPRQQGIWFDLPELGRQMLLQMGIPAAHIDLLNVCTYCMAEAGSSYRRNTHFASGYQSRYSWIRRLAGR
ncbi:polyphenol oxidase family protein [[Erwinia] mediterraneensis]|uniref:polyphenol oxidase family protein n=1 Tax=[Erwinia] mediterraneensis TaxID=2161819 RepID=UPI001F1666E3|nr:polyphenol oxidase family protein [[Erwinia] mediterraneensis]